MVLLPQHNRLKRFLAAVATGVVAGALVVECAREATACFTGAKAPAEATKAMALPEDDPAMQYARALQAGDWDAVVERTAWMQARLNRVRAESNDPAEPARSRTALVYNLSARPPIGNCLRAEGIEDQYVFAPGASIVPVRRDPGRRDVDPAAVNRIWFRVTFRDRAGAPRDESGQPIRALTVGVNVDAAGRVVKAGVVGNLDVERTSISYSWESVTGG